MVDPEKVKSGIEAAIDRASKEVIASKAQTIHYTLMLEDGQLVQDTAVFFCHPDHEFYPLEVLSFTRDLVDFGEHDWRRLHVSLSRKLLKMGARQPFTQFHYDCALESPGPTKIIVSDFSHLVDSE